MRTHKTLWVVAALLVGTTNAATANLSRSDAAHQVMLADGRRLAAGAVALDATKGLTWTGADGGAQKASLDQLVELRFPPSGTVAAAAEASVRYHDGSFLVGEIRGGGEEVLDFQLAAGVRIPIAIDAISAVFLGPYATTADPTRYRTSDVEDTIYRRPEAGGDFTTGTFLSFGESDFLFHYTLGDQKFPIQEVEAVFLSLQWELPEQPNPYAEVDLWPDGSLHGKFIRLTQDHLVLEPLFAESAVSLPRSSVRGVRFPGEGHIWLSDVSPVSATELPYFGESSSFLYPYRVDRSVTGRPLQVGSRHYAKGFGCHSRTQLDFDLAPLAAKSFQAEVGVAAEVRRLAHSGSVEFAVLLDGVEVYRSDAMRASDQAVRVGPIDLTGKSRLSLVTDFGADQDIADRGVWGDVLLLK